MGEEKVPVRVEFTENSLTYMDRLLLKKLLRYTDGGKSVHDHTYIFYSGERLCYSINHYT